MLENYCTDCLTPFDENRDCGCTNAQKAIDQAKPKDEEDGRERTEESS